MPLGRRLLIRCAPAMAMGTILVASPLSGDPADREAWECGDARFRESGIRDPGNTKDLDVLDSRIPEVEIPIHRYLPFANVKSRNPAAGLQNDVILIYRYSHLQVGGG